MFVIDGRPATLHTPVPASMGTQDHVVRQVCTCATFKPELRDMGHIFTNRKRSLGQGNVFQPVFDGVGGVCPIACWDTHPLGRYPLGKPPRQTPPR